MNAIVADALCFPLKMFAVLWILPWLSREKQKWSAWRETNPDDFFSPGFEVLWYCSSMERQRARSGHARVAFDNYGKDHNFISLYHKLWTHIHTIKFFSIYKTFHFPNSKGKSNCWQNGPFALDWPHLNKHPQSPHTTFTAGLPHSIQILLGESTMSSLIQQNACPI